MGEGSGHPVEKQELGRRDGVLWGLGPVESPALLPGGLVMKIT